MVVVVVPGVSCTGPLLVTGMVVTVYGNPGESIGAVSGANCSHSLPLYGQTVRGTSGVMPALYDKSFDDRAEPRRSKAGWAEQGRFVALVEQASVCSAFSDRAEC